MEYIVGMYGYLDNKKVIYLETNKISEDEMISIIKDYSANLADVQENAKMLDREVPNKVLLSIRKA